MFYTTNVNIIIIIIINNEIKCFLQIRYDVCTMENGFVLIDHTS